MRRPLALACLVLLLGAGFTVDPDLMIAKADALRRSGHRTEALAVLDRAQIACPDHLGVLVEKGRLLDRMGRKAEADAIFQAFPDRIGKEGIAGKELTALAIGCQEQALRTHDKELLKRVMKDLYSRAQEAEPKHAPARVEAGLLFLEKYQYGDAEKEFKVVLEDTQDPQALTGMARVFWGRGDFAKAYGFCEEALKAKPGLEEPLLLLAGLSLWDQDPDGLAKWTGEVLKNDPQCEEALVLQAASAFVTGRADEGRALMARAEALRPGWPEAFRIVAGVMESWHRSGESILWLERGLRLFPGEPGLLGDLGEILLHSSREEEGRKFLEHAYEKDPFNSRLSNTLNLLDEVSAWPVIQTRHFRIRCHPSEAPLLADLLARDLERDYEEVTALYGYEPAEQPIDVELYPQQDQFAVRTLGQPSIGATGVCFGRFMAVDSPAVRAQMGPFHWGDVARHEFTHVVTLQRTGFRVPRWLTEGLSTYAEQYHRGEEFDRLLVNGAAQGLLMKVTDINRAFTHPQFPWHVQLAYCQGGAMSRYVAETWGFEGILKMLKLYRDGKATPEVIQEALGVTPEEFDRGFQADLAARLKHIQRSPDLDDDALETLAGTEPKDPGQQLVLALQFAKRGNWKSMMVWTDRILAADKVPAAISGGASALAGEALRRTGKPREADALYRQAVAQAPDYFLGHLGLGILLKGKGEHEKAIEEFRQARRCYPTMVQGEENPYLLEADSCFALNRPEEGIKALKLFCEYNSADTPPRLALARALRDQGRPEEALKVLDVWLMGEVYNLEHHRLRAEILAGLKRPAEAAEALGLASWALPKDLKAALDAAQAWLDAGDGLKAKLFWERARKIAPNDPKVVEMGEKLGK